MTDTIKNILSDKGKKTKEKVIALSQLLMDKELTLQQLIGSAARENDVYKATLIEALETSTRKNPEIINKKAFEFLIESLNSEAPRVKWESARTLANTAQLFPKDLGKAVANLLNNAEHSGTVVRWSAATALSSVLKCKTSLNKELIPAIEAIEKRETDNAIKKIYTKTLLQLK